MLLPVAASSFIVSTTCRRKTEFINGRSKRASRHSRPPAEKSIFNSSLAFVMVCSLMLVMNYNACSKLVFKVNTVSWQVIGLARKRISLKWNLVLYIISFQPISNRTTLKFMYEHRKQSVWINAIVIFDNKEEKILWYCLTWQSATVSQPFNFLKKILRVFRLIEEQRF